MCEFAVITEYNLDVLITLSCWHTQNMTQFAFQGLHLTDKQVACTFFFLNSHLIKR